MDLPAPLAALASAQLGVLSRAQLLDGGVNASAVRWGVGTAWTVLLPGVVMLHTGVPSYQQRLVAALLYAGTGSWLAGHTAATFYRIPFCEPRLPVEVLVPAPRRSRTVAWVNVRATTITGERLVERGPLTLSCRARAVVDAAADCSDDRAVAALMISSVQERLVSLDDLHHWARLRRRNGSRRLVAALEASALGAWSIPEAELGFLLKATDLPPAWANPGLSGSTGRRLTTPDLWIDDVALAVMVHSREFHGEHLDWEATVDSDEDLRESGVEVVAVTPMAIRRYPARVVQRIERAYARASARRRPLVTATPKITVPV
ncbi:MAG: hypothetical protein M3Y26_05395 [Actinomycetota bacterium]|nr:hypothetical protein [Actinomycetota bacterium]